LNIFLEPNYKHLFYKGQYKPTGNNMTMKQVNAAMQGANCDRKGLIKK